MLFSLPWSAALALLPLTALAQQAPQFYVGASAGLVRFAPFETYAATQLGPAATVGVQLSSRWAVETSAQLSWRQDAYHYRSIDPSYIATSAANYTTLILPLLARYSFTAPRARLRIDGLGGISWVHSATRVQYTPATTGQAAVDDSHYSGNSAAVVVGPQVRYALGSALEVKLNVPFNLAVLGNNEGNFREQSFLSPQIGVQYTFAH
ncbi:MAG: hypothetical protein EOO62_38410 [Hymenobacter sp.]|nr:MAG: hypothetical protein EOO62_38410 [Hymenobacter sp.]